jgi:lipoprotein NlpI
MEQAGTYIMSYSASHNGKLTHDDIQSIAAGVIKTTILDEHRTMHDNVITFYAKISADVDTKVIDKYINNTAVADSDKSESPYTNHRAVVVHRSADGNDNGVVATSRIDKIHDNEQLLQATQYYNAGNTLFLQGNFEQAINQYNVALSIYDKYAAAFAERGIAYLRLGFRVEASKDLNTALALDRSLVICHYYLGEMADSIGDQETAIKHYQAFVYESKPNTNLKLRTNAYTRIANIRKYLSTKSMFPNSKPWE